MKKKIISIAIIGLFFFTTVTTVSSIKIPVDYKKSSLDDTPQLEIISFPNSASENEIIEFKVHYSDPNNQLPPTYLDLIVDNKEKVEKMEKIPGSGPDYDADYIYTSKEYEFEPGIHTYYVRCWIDKDPTTPGGDCYVVKLPDPDEEEQINLEILKETSKNIDMFFKSNLNFNVLIKFIFDSLNNI